MKLLLQLVDFLHQILQLDKKAGLALADTEMIHHYALLQSSAGSYLALVLFSIAFALVAGFCAHSLREPDQKNVH